MNLVNQHILLAAGWLLWCALHSLLITESWMRRVRDRFGARYAYYRLFYVIVSIVTLAPVLLLQLRIDSPILWSWPPLLKPLQWGGLLLSAGIFVVAARQYDQGFFLGLKQIREHMAGREAEFSDFVATGILCRMRHPYYSAGILLLLFWGDLTVANLILKIIGIGYFIIGAFLEERKLIARFGAAYMQYRTEVPMFVPRLSVRSAKR